MPGFSAFEYKRHNLTLEPDGRAKASAMPVTSGFEISAATAGDRSASESAARTAAGAGGDPTSATWLLQVAAKEARVPLVGKAAAWEASAGSNEVVPSCSSLLEAGGTSKLDFLALIPVAAAFKRFGCRPERLPVVAGGMTASVSQTAGSFAAAASSATGATLAACFKRVSLPNVEGVAAPSADIRGGDPGDSATKGRVPDVGEYGNKGIRTRRDLAPMLLPGKEAGALAATGVGPSPSGIAIGVSALSMAATPGFWSAADTAADTADFVARLPRNLKVAGVASTTPGWPMGEAVSGCS